MKRLIAVAALLLAVATPARAQSAAGRLIEAARAQLGDLNPDSAATLLEAALAPGRGATPAEQVRGFVLYGIAQLLRDNVAAAQVAFRQALQRDPALRVDSLDFFTGALQREFSAARQAAGPVAAAAFAVEVSVPADTTLAASGAGLRVETQPAYPSRVIATIVAVDATGATVWSDTQEVSGVGRATWNLRGTDGAIAAAGRYALRVKAIDSTGQVSPERERLLVLSRVDVDTAPAPRLLPDAFVPETLYLRRGSPAGLAAGLAIAAGAAFLPAAAGNAGLRDGASNGVAYAVGGAVSVATIVGFIRGSRMRPLPANIASNAAVRQRHDADLRRVADENARRREAAPVRVRVEGTGP